MLLCRNKVSTIFDVGAHTGETVAKYKPLFPRSTIYSFEPFPESFEKLRKRFVSDSSVKPIPIAISDKAGIREFYVNQLSEANSLLPRPTSGRRYYPMNAQTITKIEVPVTTIDGFCKEQSISEIHILKMDIQGGELMALQGATEYLSRGLIALIYTELLFVPHYEGGGIVS
jgi:FkbM family methyltransferase